MNSKLIIFIACLMLLQLITSLLHFKYYQKTIQKMSQKSSGFLGVGMSKKKFLPRRIIAITTDIDGVINGCQILSGLTVFSMFKKCDHFVNQHIKQITHTSKTAHYAKALEMATSHIKTEMEKGQINNFNTV